MPGATVAAVVAPRVALAGVETCSSTIGVSLRAKSGSASVATFELEIGHRIFDGDARLEQIRPRIIVGELISDGPDECERPQRGGTEIAHALAEEQRRRNGAAAARADAGRAGAAPFAVGADGKEKFVRHVLQREIFHGGLEILPAARRAGARPIEPVPAILDADRQPLGDGLVEDDARIGQAIARPRQGGAGRRLRAGRQVGVVGRRDLRQQDGRGKEPVAGGGVGEGRSGEAGESGGERWKCSHAPIPPFGRDEVNAVTSRSRRRRRPNRARVGSLRNRQCAPRRGREAH